VRLFEAIHAGCIPVLLSDEVELPFQDIVSWETFSAPRSREKKYYKLASAKSGGSLNILKPAPLCGNAILNAFSTARHPDVSWRPFRIATVEDKHDKDPSDKLANLELPKETLHNFPY
jgi:hypothetical protein